ncbi:MAG: phosphonate C-P lyase system protein PhnL [Pseudomonadota bacterium]
MIELRDVAKTFKMHNHDGAALDVMVGASFRVARGECVALTGSSGVGKSTLMRMIYGNYLASSGSILVGDTDVARAEPREVLTLRRDVLGYVSQFLRVVPRVPTLDVVAEPLIAGGTPEAEAMDAARTLLKRLKLPETLWNLPPMTFSGGEQQRVNIARGFVRPMPALLLDEPTASLDQVNRRVVLDLIHEAKDRGAAIVGIFHDAAARTEVADREIDVASFAPVAA